MHHRSRLPLLLTVAVALTAPPAHAASADPAFSVGPAPGSALTPRGGYFRIETRAGSTVTQAIVLRNRSTRPVAVRLAAVDAETAQFGGASYALPTKPRRRVGKWITLERRSVRLGGLQTLTIPFTVSVPGGVASGEHLGGIAVWSPPQREAPERARADAQARTSVVVHTRRVIAVLVRAPGPAVPRLHVSGVEPVARPDGVYLHVRIANRGGAMTKAKGVVVLPQDSFTRRFAVDTLVPGTAIGYPVRWTRRPEEGDHDARVEVRYGSRRAVWIGSFAIGEAISAELADRGASGRVETSGGEDYRLAAAGAAGGVVAALLVWLVARSRRRRSRTSQPSA